MGGVLDSRRLPGPTRGPSKRTTPDAVGGVSRDGTTGLGPPERVRSWTGADVTAFGTDLDVELSTPRDGGAATRR